MQIPNTETSGGNGNRSAVQTGDAESHHVPTHYAPWTGRLLAIGVCVLGIALAAGFFLMHEHRSNETDLLQQETAQAIGTPPVVDVVSVRPSPTTQPLTLPGETQAWYASTIYARVSGYVANWFVDIGDKVKKGKVLAVIDTPELDAQLRAATANLNAAESQVVVEKANADFANTTYERWKDSPTGVVSIQDREAKKADYQSSIAKVQAAEAQVKLHQADVESLQALTEFKQVVAPYDGVITSRHIDIGNLVMAGSANSTTSLYNIDESDTIRVFVDVPQNVSNAMVVDMPVIVTASQFPDRKFKGKIARTASAIDPVSRTLRVEADIANPDLALVAGMYVEVNFELPEKSLLQVPASALQFRSTGQQVAVVGSDGKISFRKVTIAVDEGDNVEIASGLSEGDRVALNVSSQLEDGDAVSANVIDQTQAAGARPGK